MASTIRLELVTPARLLVSEEVDEVIAPGYEGEFGVLPDHTPFLAILSIGVLRYRKNSREWKIAVGGGFAEVTPDRVVILADVAEKAEEIDVDRARRAHGRAEAALKDLVMDDAEFDKMNSALQRSIARLSAAE
ncbi:MAG: F0F1 ATP synthase subunit epsilon [Thermodesulfobacteriota bacterium]|nr:F0F1 ATP synthase subunit epsilon [Thermodesulfobacteriota bacterium]